MGMIQAYPLVRYKYTHGYDTSIPWVRYKHTMGMIQAYHGYDTSIPMGTIQAYHGYDTSIPITTIQEMVHFCSANKGSFILSESERKSNFPKNKVSFTLVFYLMARYC